MSKARYSGRGENGHFDAIVHLAAQTMVPASMEDPKKDMEDNIEGTVNILEAARKYGVKRIIFLLRPPFTEILLRSAFL